MSVDCVSGIQRKRQRKRDSRTSERTFREEAGRKDGGKLSVNYHKNTSFSQLNKLTIMQHTPVPHSHTSAEIGFARSSFGDNNPKTSPLESSSDPSSEAFLTWSNPLS